MQPRTYALMMAAVGLGLFLIVAAANLLIDPVNVFGTGLLPRAPNANDRYERVVAYRAEPGTYDGLAFGSSRAGVIPLDDLSRRMDGVNFASFVVVGGMLLDHVAALEFVLRDKAAKREPLRAVFLLLDVDVLGRRPFTNESTQFLMPPALSGENPARFWWKNLVTIQFKAWRSALVAARNARSTTSGDASPAHARRHDLRAMVLSAAHAEPVSDAPPQPCRRGGGSARKDCPKGQLSGATGTVAPLVALCRDHGIRLDVATSPLSREGVLLYDPEDLQTAIDDVARIVPCGIHHVQWVSNNPNCGGRVPFPVGSRRMMLRRMYGGDLPPSWSDFGRRLSR